MVLHLLYLHIAFIGMFITWGPNAYLAKKDGVVTGNKFDALKFLIVCLLQCSLLMLLNEDSSTITSVVF
jgi:hypothetical protein